MKKSKMQSKNNVNVIGEGERVMLFAHGYGCDQNMWRFITPAFQEQYKIVLFDHVGSGKSDLKAYNYEKYSSLSSYADDIIEICEAFELKNVTLVAHSVSAMIGLLAVTKAPVFFENLVMICPSPCYINNEGYQGGFSKMDIEELLESLGSNYLGWSSAIAPVIMGNPEKPELSEELANSFCQNDPKIAEHFAGVTFLGDNRKDLSKTNIKTLIIQCTSDVIAPMEVGKYVHENMFNSTLSIIDATGHCPHLSAPQETIVAIKSFLEV